MSMPPLTHPGSPVTPASSVVAIYSGGMDSFTLLNRLARQSVVVHALSFDYGQRHKKELTFARKVCENLLIPHKIIDIGSINQLLTGSSLTDDIAVPEGHYEDQSMRNTVVPNRNMIMLSLAIGYAVSVRAEKVVYGAHSGDHAIYPDCRPDFVAKMNAVAAIANYEPVIISAPYLHWSKTDILREGITMGLDYRQTWTCYNGREKACGRCGSCVERLEAFAANGLQDPVAYE
jgi:7-cyano-7-deazaguanine synthase